MIDFNSRDYTRVEASCKILQKLTKPAYAKIHMLLEKPLSRYKGYAECYWFENLNTAQVKALQEFLLAKKIKHRWTLEFESPA